MKKLALLLLFIAPLYSTPPWQLSFGAGAFNVLRKDTSWQFQAELKPKAQWHTIRPLVGFMMTVKGATFLYGGFSFDWVICERFVLSPSFAPGWYKKGSDKDLGYPLEFRSGIEVGWQSAKMTRLTLLFAHMSNASLGSKNPGAESLVLSLYIPLN